MPQFAPSTWGIPTVNSTADRSTLFPTPTTNQQVFNLQTAAYERYNGSTWVTVFAAALQGDPTGVTDVTAALQVMHDALPSTGGLILVPDGLYLLEADGIYVNVTKPNVEVRGSRGAWLVSPGSADAEVRTGNRCLNGLRVSGTGCTISVNLRGPLVLWEPQTANDTLVMRDMICLNLYNSGIQIGTGAFDGLLVHNVDFNTSRDLASDLGNYEAIERAANSTDGAGRLITVSACRFRAVGGAIDCHNVRNLVVTNGTRFEGVDIDAIKLATLDGVEVEQNLVVDESVTFDGTPINAGSANRHLNLTPQAADRTMSGTRYFGFLQVFQSVQWHARHNNAPNNGVVFLDGSQTTANINMDRAKFTACPIAIQDAQGIVSMQHMDLRTSNVMWTIAGAVKRLHFEKNQMIDSYVAFTKKSVDGRGMAWCLKNEISYSVDNLGPIRFVNYGVDNGMNLVVDDNEIAITGIANTRVADLSTSGTLGIWQPGNRTTAIAGAPVINGGLFPSVYEQATAPGTYSLFLSGLHHGEFTVTNPNAAGTITYDIRDAALNAEVGSVFHVFRSHASNNLAFLATTMRGAPGSGTTATATTQYASATLRKVGAGAWILVATTGTWTVA